MTTCVDLYLSSSLEKNQICCAFSLRLLVQLDDSSITEKISPATETEQERERERESERNRDGDGHTYIYIYIHIHTKRKRGCVGKDLITTIGIPLSSAQYKGESSWILIHQICTREVSRYWCYTCIWRTHHMLGAIFFVKNRVERECLVQRREFVDFDPLNLH